MFRELRGMEYVLEIIRVLTHHDGYFDSKTIHSFIVAESRIEASLTYIQKVLQRMVKLDLLVSSEAGYILAKPLHEITIDNVLLINDMPLPESRVYSMCRNLLELVKTHSVTEFYDFS